MRQRLGRWLVSLVKALQPGFIALAEWNGFTPSFRWLLEQDTDRAGQRQDPAALPAGHPERLLPHVPPTLEESLLWDRLELGTGCGEQDRNHGEDPGR